MLHRPNLALCGLSTLCLLSLSFSAQLQAAPVTPASSAVATTNPAPGVPAAAAPAKEKKPPASTPAARNPKPATAGTAAVGTQAADPKAPDPKTADPKSAEPKAPDNKVAEPKRAEPKPADAKAPDNKAAEPKASDSKAAEAKTTTPQAAGHQRPTALNARITVKVASAADARRIISAKLLELRGFASHITDSALHLKVPPENLPALLEVIAAQGIVLDKSLEREDLALEIANLEGQLKSKRSVLTELRGFFDTSDVASTLKIETSMNELVQELESVKGKLRVLRERARYGVVHVDFNYYQRQRVGYVQSEFDWLNSVNLSRFLEEF